MILASQSPRRRELLHLIGIAHEVMPADVDESLRSGEAPHIYAARVAIAKVEKVVAANRDAVVIGADTIVVLDGDVLGKPADPEDAARMLRRLSGRSHTVQTAVAVAYDHKILSAVETVGVTFRALSAEDIVAYLATGEPLDKAGAYGIQGFGATIVERVDGDYFSVMGLGLRRLVSLLDEAGVTYAFARGLNRRE